MSLLKRFIIVNVLLITGLVVYLSYLSQNPKLDSKPVEKNEVLAATTDEFETFTPATINQYPVISYPDGKTVPFQDRFAVIRKYSSPTKFTNHLCNTVNESLAPWKNDTQGCGYAPNPTFVKLNFDGVEKLMLYAYYGLYSIVPSTDSNVAPTVKWQSAHIDRFQSPTIATACGWTYDPSSVIPVKSGSNFYLFSKFSGLNNSNCLQFYDKAAAKPSFSQSTGKLYLGYEVSSNGELNTNSYNRTTLAPYINLAIGGPFGPGPKNATYYANSPTSDIYGCVSFDSKYNCTKVQGIALQPAVITPQTEIKGACTRWEYHDDWCQAASFGTENSDGECVDFGPASCGRCGGAKCCNGTQIKVLSPDGSVSQVGVCKAWAPSTFVGGSFKSSVNSPTFSTFQDFNFNPFSKTWNTTSVAVPADYNVYLNEVNSNNAAHPINFTKDLNSTVFTSNNYMYKVAVLSGRLNIKRYSLNPSTYTPGSTSYISSSYYSIDLQLGNASNNKYSLQYNSKDIYLLAAGAKTFNFYKIKNLNTTGENIAGYDLSYEISRKITGTPQAFGIASGKIYVIVGNQVLYSGVTGTGGIEVPDLNYANFEVNGSVYTRTDLTEKFIVTNPSKKLEGSYITEASTVSTNIKSVKGVNFSFDYPSSLPRTLLNFTVYSTTFNKFNLLVGSSTAVDGNPLAASSYVSISPTIFPTPSNPYELVYISANKGVKIDLNNANLNNGNFKLDKYIFVNLDKGNNSRINFTIDCTKADYSIICTAGNKFYMKGALLGQFTITGNPSPAMATSRFINVSENPELILKIAKDLRSKKYPMVTTSKINVKYSQ